MGVQRSDRGSKPNFGNTVQMSSEGTFLPDVALQQKRTRVRTTAPQMYIILTLANFELQTGRNEAATVPNQSYALW